MTAEISRDHNPLRDPDDRRLNRIAGPSALVIFGVTGDLSRKKLMPAVYDLANRGLLPPGFALVVEQQIGEAHQPPPHCPLRRLLTGSCLAARDAGSQLKKSPVKRAAGRVQSVACQGTAAGKVGQTRPARATRA